MLGRNFMNEIRLLKLELRDFQGGNFAFQPDGKDSYVFGQNASGKTRLVSAFTFLLFGKDAMNRADFEIKNLDGTGEAAHGLEHSVEADLSVNGEAVNLKKVYKEKWTKKRGNAQREFSGHTTDYYVNGVPLQEKLYTQHISDIAGDESRFRLLTSPTTFPQLHWQKQRQLLLDICGDISDTDIIASNEKLFPLTAILGKHTLDDHRKIVTARRSEINKEMEKIPVRIDEVRRGLPDVTGIDRKKSEQAVVHFETVLNDSKLRLQGVDTGGSIADLTKKLSGLNADLRKMEDAHRSGSLSTLNRLNQQISEGEAIANASRRRITTIDGDLKQKEGIVTRIETELSNLRSRWTAIDGETFDPEGVRIL
jgi:DNA repair exonuclease SbcCD ATPase subunit